MEMKGTSMEPAIATSDLTCHYGRTEAVRGLTLTVQPGSIFALLGPNGAGKTSTVRMLMNILRPSGGRATVLGVDSRRLGVNELATIGYVSENQKLPTWMTVGELLAFCRPLYPSWDEALCRKLLGDFDLRGDAKIASLSRGMRVKAALVSSLACRPRLLVLDEPFSGLDPVVRDDLVHGVLELAGQEQWTVFISSHDLDEVERLVDTAAFIDAGRLVLAEPFADLHARFRRIEVTLASAVGAELAPPSGPSETAGPGETGGPSKLGPYKMAETWIGAEHAGRVVRFVETRYVEGETERRATELFAATHVDAQPMTLREIFVAIVRERRRAQR
jgi:ABC-2 type transport system ATP-binding protein